MQSRLTDAFRQTLKPTLETHGFSRVELESCIHPEELWRRDRLWLGASFDWRDQYFEIALGHLYWFRDVMPRVIVLGEYSSYASFDPYERFKSDGLGKTLRAVSESFANSLKVYDTRYPEILQARLQPKNSKYAKEFVLNLGEEVKDEELGKHFA
jgi:hypothetical protein